MTTVYTCFLTLTLNMLLCLSECTCFLPEIYTIGVLKLSSVKLYPTFTTRWCDDVMLCGRAPLSLRVVVIETTLNDSVQMITQYPSINFWLLSTTAEANTTSTSAVVDHLTKEKKHYLDYTQRALPHNDAEWCAVVVKFAYSTSSNEAPDAEFYYVNYVLSVVGQAGFKTLVVVYDNSTEMEVLHLSEGLSTRRVLHVLHKTDPDVTDPVWRDFWGLRKNVVDFEDYTDVLIWCNSSCVKSFLEEIAPREKGAHTDIGTQHMTRVLIVDSSLQFNLSSTAPQNRSATANTSLSLSSLLDHPNETMTRDLEDVLDLVNTFYHVAVLWKGGDCIRLQSLTKTADGSRSLSYSGFGDNRGNILMTSEVFPNTRWRLNGQKFIVATAVWEPFVMVSEVKGKLHYTGLCIDMLEALAITLNFTYELVQPADGQYGSIENGSWTGLVRMLKDKKAQLVVAPIAVNELRATVVDFSTPFYQDYTGVLFKRPDPALHKWKTYFRPFSLQVLICIGIAFIIATAFGHIVGVKSAELIFPTKRTESDVMDTVQYFFGSLLAQGGVWSPTTGSARMFVAAWWIFCVIMAAIYSGNLTASFAVTLYDPSFTTLQEMLEEGTYDFGTVPGTIWFDIFKFSNRSDFKQIEQKMMEFVQEHSGENINETGDHVRRTAKGDYAYIGNMASLAPTVDTNCDLMILEETFLPLQYAIALQKDSPLTDAVSTWILQMNEGGLDLLWASNWWSTTEGKCGVSKVTGGKVVTLMDCQSAFYVLLIGFVVAFLAIMAESGFHWFVRRKCQAQPDHVHSPETRQIDSSFSASPADRSPSGSRDDTARSREQTPNGIPSITGPDLYDVFSDITDFSDLDRTFKEERPTCNGNGSVHFNY